MSTIRTRWHKLLDNVAKDEAYFTAPKGGKALHWDQVPGVSKGGFSWMLRQFDAQLPKFVVDSELIELVMSEGYEKSIVDMKKAGLLRSPYPGMIIEFDLGSRHFVMLRDLQFDNKFNFEGEISNNMTAGKPFYGIVFRAATDEDGDYTVLSPSIGFLNVEERDGEPWIGIASTNMDYLKKSDFVEQLVKDTWVKDAAAIYRGLATAMLVMHTGGVRKEVIECDKINRKRVAAGKTRIPSHTYLSIGKVYRSAASDEADDYVPRKSPRPHWRKGHLRTVLYGTGRQLTKQKYINPKLVAFKEGIDEEPSMQKTYVMRK